VIILILVFIAVYVLLSLVTKGEEYAAERLFFKAIDAYQKMAINPEVTPAGVIASVENKFRNVIEKYPDTATGKKAHIVLAEFYMSNQDYNKAIETLNAFIDTGYEDIPLMSKAHFYKAATFEKQDQWDEALKEYQILRDRYFKTSVGMMVPLYLGRCYARKGDPAKSSSAYREAIMFYEQLEKTNRGTRIGYTGADLLTQAYMEIGKIEAAGSVVEATIKNYPNIRTYERYLPLVEYIYAMQLKRPQKAVEIFKGIMEKTENDNLKEFLEKKIEELEGKAINQPKSVK